MNTTTYSPCSFDCSGSMIKTVSFFTCLAIAAFLSVTMQAQDGLLWSSSDSGTLADLRTIRSGPGNTVYAAGSGTTLLQWNGLSWQTATGWNTTDSGFLSEGRWENALIGSLGIDQNGVVYVGSPTDSRMAIFDPNTGTWSQQNPFTSSGSAHAAQMGIINGSDSSVILIQPRGDNTVGFWQNPIAGTQSNPNLRTVATGGAFNYVQSGGASGTSMGNMWVAATYNGTGRLMRGTGTTVDDWTLITSEAGVTMTPAWRSVHAVSESFVVVGGQGPGSSGANGLVGIWEETNPDVWQELGYFANHAIFAVYATGEDSIWAAGIHSSSEANFLTYYNGISWTEIDIGGTGGLRSLTMGEDGTMWVAGNNGQIYMGVIPEPHTWAAILSLVTLGLAWRIRLSRAKH